MNNFLRGTFALIVILLLFKGQIWSDGKSFLDTLSKAQGNIEAGPVKFHPGVGLENSYDDNIYNTPTNPYKDYITNMLAGMYLSIGEKIRLDTGYAVSVNRYDTYKEENFIGHDATLKFVLPTNKGFLLTINDSFLQTTAPRDRIDNPLRASYNFNGLNTRMGFLTPAKKFGVDVFYSMNYLKYLADENRALNKQDNYPGLELKFKFLPKTEFFTKYTFGMEKYYAREVNNLDRQTHQVEGGVRFDLLENMDIEASGGYYLCNFEDSALEDFEFGIYSANLGFKSKIMGKTRLFFFGSSSINNSEYAGNTTYKTSSSTLYLKNTGGAGLSWQINHRMEFLATGSYSKHEYNLIDKNTDPRIDRLVQADAKFSYFVHNWLYTSIKYTYSKNVSNDELRYQLNNSATLNITAAL